MAPLSHRKGMMLLSVVFFCFFSEISVVFGAGAKPVWLAVARPMFVEGLRPLAAHRAREGFETVISVKDIKTSVAEMKQKPAYILLVGDYEPGREQEGWYLAGQRRRMYRWRWSQREYFVTDVVWGDWDGDGRAESPVGRLPVRTVGQLRELVDRIIAYENQPMRRSDLRLPIWTGTPDFNPILDGLVTQLGWQAGKSGAPVWSDLWVILSNCSHPLCGWPPDQPALFSLQIQSGGFLAAMVGHGIEEHFYSMKHDGEHVVYEAADARRYLSPEKQSIPLAIIACYCGNFGGAKPCLAESLLLTAGGPPAVIAATTESQPLTNFYTCVSLLKHLDYGPKRLGDLWLTAQNGMLGMRTIVLERLLKHVEGKLEAELDIAKVKRDQMLMHAFLGDPALRMRLPERLEASLEQTSTGWRWRVKKPEGAQRLYVEFRKEIGVMSASAERSTSAQFEREFAEASSQLRFGTLEELDSSVDWEGEIHQSGTLRLVAECKSKLYVTAWKL